MFINCSYCHALVATDPATDQPPERCPHCAAKLRESPVEVVAASDDLTAAAPVLDAAKADPNTAQTIADTAASLADMPAADALAPSAPTSAPASVPIAAPESTAPVATTLAAVATTTDATTAGPITASGNLQTPAAPVSESDAVASAEMPSSADPATPADVVETAEVQNSEALSIEEGSGSVRHPRVGGNDDPGLNDSEVTDKPSVDMHDQTDETDETAATPSTAIAVKPSPSFARQNRRFHVRAGWQMHVAIAGLSLLLLLQLLLADRAQLAAQARWRPLLTTLCNTLGCDLPAWHEPAAIIMLARDVRPYPAAPGALRVTATFRNDARWAQAWPIVQLTLSDVDGTPVAARAFSPHEYLGTAPAQALLDSGQSATVSMLVREPEAHTVAFNFELR